MEFPAVLGVFLIRGAGFSQQMRLKGCLPLVQSAERGRRGLFKKGVVLRNTRTPRTLPSGNRKWWRQTGSRQSTPLSTIRTRYGNSVSTPGATRTGKRTSRIFSKKGADTEFQYRPHIVDTDTDCGRRFGGRHFRDSYAIFKILRSY